MEENILAGGINELRLLKSSVLQLNDFKAQEKLFDAEEKKLKKSIENKEKAMAKDIDDTTKERKSETEKTYDEQIELTQKQLKKVQANKDKAKKAAVQSRIDAETAAPQEVDRNLNFDSKSILKQEKVPKIYNNRLFFALFMPKGIGDIAIIILALIIVLFIIPCGIYFLLLGDQSVLYLVLLYVATVLVFGGIYLIINKTKCKHNIPLSKVRELRQQLAASKKEQRRIKKSIVEDTDESLYGLEEYNNEINVFEAEIAGILDQKKKALSDFEANKRPAIVNEIKARYVPDITNLKSEDKRAYDSKILQEDNIKKLSMEISDKYGSLLGKDLMTIEKINRIEEVMMSNGTATISEAITLLNQKK